MDALILFWIASYLLYLYLTNMICKTFSWFYLYDILSSFQQIPMVHQKTLSFNLKDIKDRSSSLFYCTFLKKLWWIFVDSNQIELYQNFLFLFYSNTFEKKSFKAQNDTIESNKRRGHSITKTHTLKWHVFEMRIRWKQVFQLCKP